MSMGFIFIYFYYSLIPYEIWTTHLTLNFHFFFHGYEESIIDEMIFQDNEDDGNIDLDYRNEFN